MRASPTGQHRQLPNRWQPEAHSYTSLEANGVNRCASMHERQVLPVPLNLAHDLAELSSGLTE